MLTFHPLPGDVLLSIFESFTPINKPTEGYQHLTQFALVCKSWALPATQVLLSYVEVIRLREGQSLIQCLQTGNKGDLVKTLVLGFRLGTDREFEDIINRTTFHQILSLTPQLRRLVAIPLSDPNSHFYPQRPRLPYLEDVTVVAMNNIVIRGNPYWQGPPDLSLFRLQGAIIGILPGHVRFLNFLDAPTRVPEGTYPHSLRLYGIAVPLYPNPFTDAVLLHSKTTLQSLTVSDISSVAFLAFHHPNLRSLKILLRVKEYLCDLDFRVLAQLERLELCDPTLPPDVARVLPKSLQYLRFWSTRLASSLVDVLQSGEVRSLLPNLRTVVWDWYEPSQLQPVALYSPYHQGPPLEAVEELRDRLDCLCLEANIQLRMAERRNGGSSPGLEKDLEYESAFRHSCFVRGLGLSSSTTGYTPPLAMLYPLPTRIISQLEKIGFALSRPLLEAKPLYEEARTRLWDEYFKGRLERVESAFAEPLRLEGIRTRPYKAPNRPMSLSSLVWPRGAIKRATWTVRSWLIRSLVKGQAE